MTFTFTCNALIVDGQVSNASRKDVAKHIKLMLGMV
jgi:hypothetical protein